MQPKYEILSDEIARKIEADCASKILSNFSFDSKNIIRRIDSPRDKASSWRPAFVHDIDKIMHCPFYSRYADKTQVFALVKNDDVTRRNLHVQLVSRIARTIGAALNLNLDLIEAIALGHDIGHTPFSHSGETYLNEIYRSHTGRNFCHNIHSVRVLDKIFPYNISLQTLDGIACHNGEFEQNGYQPVPQRSFAKFDEMIEQCYTDWNYANSILPSTLEGCVVRIADIIAYVGKDRQDAIRLNLIGEEAFTDKGIGSINAELINNLVVNIIDNSYGKPYVKMDSKHFQALKTAKVDNYFNVYATAANMTKVDTIIKPMMEEIYDRMLADLINQNKQSPIYLHHIDYVNRAYYTRQMPYEDTEPNQLVVDYIAGMTDDYFIELHHYLFPDSPYKVEYKGYFD